MPAPATRTLDTMALPPQFLEELRSRLGLSDVVGKRIRLQRAGREFKSPCPFHKEKTPSFYVNDQKGFFHCLAGETGVMLPGGTVPIATLAGTRQRVLTRGGSWVEADFRSYGRQRLWRIELSRNGQRKAIHATDGHRWFVRGNGGAVLTRDLRPGHRLETVLPEPRTDWTLDPEGVRHGIVFGGGSGREGDSDCWVVQSVTPTDREEEVYCAEVPGTHAFALEDNILTGNCFGCGAHGDVIGFVMRHDNLSFMEAVELLAGEAGLQVPKASPQERQKFEQQKTLFDLIERACRHYEGALRGPQGRGAYEYLRSRGLDDESMARFRLGYAPQDGGPLRSELLGAGFSEAQLIEAGLFKQPDDGRTPYAFFRHRVLFPVADRRGRVVAFGGRILDGSGPKYINSADNPLFHKGHLLYGMSRARQAAADGQPLIVTEGYMDVISCVQAGFGGAVAPLGTALTETQIQELWKLAPEGRRVPVLCFDGDNAGRRAAQRAVERILPLLLPDHSARVAFLPEKEDPDSLIRSGGPGAFQIVLDRARSLADVLFDMEAEGRDLSQADARAGLEAALKERCAQIQHPGVRRAYDQDMRDRLYQLRRRGNAAGSGRAGAPGGQGGYGQGGYGQGAYGQAAYGQGGFGRRGVDAGGAIGISLPVSRLWDPRFRSGTVKTEPRWRERLLLLPVLNHPALFDAVGEELARMTFADPELEHLRRDLVACLSGESGLDGDGLRRHLSSRGHAGTLDSLLSADAPRFAHPGASIDAARSGWQEVWLASQELALQAELREAERRLAEEFSEENLFRLEALRREVLNRRGHAAGLTDAEE